MTPVASFAWFIWLTVLLAAPSSGVQLLSSSPAGALQKYVLSPLNRSDKGGLERVLKHGEPAYWIPTVGGKSVTTSTNEAVLLTFSPADISTLMHDSSQVRTVIYLGSRPQGHYVALDLSEECALAEKVRAHFKLASLRSVADAMDRTAVHAVHAVSDGGGVVAIESDAGLHTDPASLLAYAIAMVTWHLATPFCSLCGSPSLPARQGSCRRCTSSVCKKSHYPRIEPAVIMLVLSECAQFALLGRKSAWPAGRYSCLAGFVEASETLEQAVCREAEEESGVGIDASSVRYFASQPWPFPSSLMLGFRAAAVAGPGGRKGSLPAIDFDKEEMDHVAWFGREEVRAALPRGLSGEKVSSDLLHLPGVSSLARTMLAAWVSEGGNGAGGDDTT